MSKFFKIFSKKNSNKKRKKKKVSYYFYRQLTRRWSKSPSVSIYGLDGTEVIILYDKDHLTIDNALQSISTNSIRDVIKIPADLFAVFNNFMGDAYRKGIIHGPVNGGPVYLELQRRWTLTSDLARDFLEDVWHSLTGEKLSFAF